MLQNIRFVECRFRIFSDVFFLTCIIRALLRFTLPDGDVEFGFMLHDIFLTNNTETNKPQRINSDCQHHSVKLLIN